MTETLSIEKSNEKSKNSMEMLTALHACRIINVTIINKVTIKIVLKIALLFTTKYFN